MTPPQKDCRERCAGSFAEVYALPCGAPPRYGVSFSGRQERLVCGRHLAYAVAHVALPGRTIDVRCIEDSDSPTGASDG